jgi:hypothetical protein
MHPALSALDESYGHQLAAPRSVTQHMDPRWAERAYYLLHVDAGLTLNAGRQLYPHAGAWSVFSGAATPEVQDCLRETPAYALGDDPDAARVGAVRIEVSRPLQTIRLVLEESSFPLAYDLTFEARLPPVGGAPTLIERDGEVITNSMSFFQSGLFSGTVVHDGVEHRVERRGGFRDRSWGLRKHDGAPRRGLVVFVGAEFEDQALYVFLLETAKGRRAHTDGWLMRDGRVQDTVAEIEHDLRFGEAWLDGGELGLTMHSGAKHTLAFTTETRLFLSGVGYSPDPAMKLPGTDRFDLTDPAVVRSLEGQTDHGSAFVLDGETHGHGYAEVGRGVHARYRPDPEA